MEIIMKIITLKHNHNHNHNTASALIFAQPNRICNTPATRSLASTDFPMELEQLVFEDEQGHSVTRCRPASSPLKCSRASMLYFPWMEMVNCPGTSMACLTLAFLWMRRGTQSFNLGVGHEEPLPKAAILQGLQEMDREIAIRESFPSHLQTMVTSPHTCKPWKPAM